MTEKVYFVHDWWDNSILAGVASFDNKPYYFTCIFSEILDDWTDEYYLTPLTENLFSLENENWAYWLHWLQQDKKNPHPIHYAEMRKKQCFEEIEKGTISLQEWKQAEQYYRNQIIIDNYLSRYQPTVKAKGVFSGSINGTTDTFVEWSNIDKRIFYTK